MATRAPISCADGANSAAAQYNAGASQAAAASAAYAAAGNPALAAQYAAEAAQLKAEGTQAGQLAAATPANSNVTRTGYAENTLTNYKAYNLKLDGGLYYKLTPATTLSLIGDFGKASTIYQGTDRYALKDVKIGQYKAEVAGKAFLRPGLYDPGECRQFL